MSELDKEKEGVVEEGGEVEVVICPEDFIVRDHSHAMEEWRRENYWYLHTRERNLIPIEEGLPH